MSEPTGNSGFQSRTDLRVLIVGRNSGFPQSPGTTSSRIYPGFTYSPRVHEVTRNNGKREFGVPSGNRSSGVTRKFRFLESLRVTGVTRNMRFPEIPRIPLFTRNSGFPE